MKSFQTEPKKVISNKVSASAGVKQANPNIKLVYLPPQTEDRDDGREAFDELLGRAAKPKK